MVATFVNTYVPVPSVRQARKKRSSDGEPKRPPAAQTLFVVTKITRHMMGSYNLLHVGSVCSSRDELDIQKNTHKKAILYVQLYVDIGYLWTLRHPLYQAVHVGWMTYCIWVIYKESRLGRVSSRNFLRGGGAKPMYIC